MHKQVIRKIGNSEGIIIPRNLLEELGFSCGALVGIEIIEGQLVVKSARPKYTLEELVAQMSPENEQAEAFTGPDVGEEIVEYEPEKETKHEKRRSKKG